MKNFLFPLYYAAFYYSLKMQCWRWTNCLSWAFIWLEITRNEGEDSNDFQGMRCFICKFVMTYYPRLLISFLLIIYPRPSLFLFNDLTRLMCLFCFFRPFWCLIVRSFELLSLAFDRMKDVFWLYNIRKIFTFFFRLLYRKCFVALSICFKYLLFLKALLRISLMFIFLFIAYTF